MGGSRPVEVGRLEASGANADLTDDLVDELPEKLATTATLLLGVVVLYLAPLAISLGCAGALIPSRAGEEARGHGGGEAER